ncbi:hypothetical protein L1987_45131 [Smallanthus sonchifolius]|uniref:Uncharacterized protein n=1 Tax=Smallanthus sonchifolius TaxID=185202 RepID=A0ACB9GRC7_9ASTR|nr:hypothetical protein L1987_45131 [Smallanthus sonchifolius]
MAMNPIETVSRELRKKHTCITENIRRVEVAKLFEDASLICIASPISPYRKDHDACRAMLTDKNFRGFHEHAS